MGRRQGSGRPAAGARHRRDRPQGAGAAEDPHGRPHRPRARPRRHRRRGRRLRAPRRRHRRRGALRRLAPPVLLHRQARGAVRRAHLRRVPRRLHRPARPQLRALAHRHPRGRPGHPREHRGDRLRHRPRHLRRADADRRREHRRHHLPGGLERARPGGVPLQPLRPALDHPGGRRIGDARRGVALAALADPQPRPRHHQPGGQGPGPADPRRVRLGREHRARQLRPRRPAAAGDRRLPRGAGGAPGALDPAEPGRRLRQPDAGRGARQLGADPAGGRGLPRPGGQRRLGRGEPLHRRAGGIRQGARGDPQAALPRDDAGRARQRPDVRDRHALRQRHAARALPAAQRAEADAARAAGENK